MNCLNRVSSNLGYSICRDYYICGMNKEMCVNCQKVIE
jgi:hypothetical protein